MEHPEQEDPDPVVLKLVLFLTWSRKTRCFLTEHLGVYIYIYTWTLQSTIEKGT